MAEVQSTFPQPPRQYFAKYTDENVKLGQIPPPPPPIQDSYSMFGAPFSSDEAIIRPLEASGLKRLYPANYDHKRELKKLNLSMVVNFLDLIDILIRAPDSSRRTEKLDDLSLLFVNMHHLINEFRPHQARETLRVMMDVQKTQRLEIAERFRKHLDKVKELLENTISAVPDDNLDNKLLIPTKLPDIGVSVKEEPADCDHVDRLDRMMCDIVDGLS